MLTFLENIAAIILPWLELFVGVSLITGVFINANSLIADVLLLVF